MEPYKHATDVGSVFWLGQLRETANEILEDAYKLHRLKGADTPFGTDAVNWGDLRCINACWYRDADGTEGPAIELSEASPGGAPVLCEWVCNRLAERGFENVTASTGW